MWGRLRTTALGYDLIAPPDGADWRSHGLLEETVAEREGVKNTRPKWSKSLYSSHTYRQRVSA